MKKSFRRRIASVIACSTALGGAMALSVPGPADAAISVTNFGLKTTAFGTYVVTGPVGLESGKTALTYIGCTRLAGKTEEAAVAAADTPKVNAVLSVGAVKSNSWTFKTSTVVAGSAATNSIAKVVLGDPNGVNITINGLSTAAKTWASKDGKLHADTTLKSLDISANTGTPLDDVFAGLGQNIGTLLGQISKAVNDTLVIPGLGRLQLGERSRSVYSEMARARADALRVQLYGADGTADTADDIKLVIGQSRTRIYRKLPAGVMSGHARPLEASLLDGTLRSRPADQPLPCKGTKGEIKTTATAGGDVLNAGVLGTGVAQSRVYGIQNRDGSAKAWTEAKIANVNLGAGALEIDAIVGRANVRRSKAGKIYRSITGSSILGLVVDGHNQLPPPPGTPIEIPGVAKVEFMVKTRLDRGIEVTAVKVTLLGDTPLNTVIKLGNARALIKRY